MNKESLLAELLLADMRSDVDSSDFGELCSDFDFASLYSLLTFVIPQTNNPYYYET